MKDTLVIYIHGKGGNAGESEFYCDIFDYCDVCGLDYGAKTPMEAKTELLTLFDGLTDGYRKVMLVANSIGAYFAMHALGEKKISAAYFISPIVDMEDLIEKMMSWANVTEEELAKKGNIETEFGETLSYEYLSYVREHPVRWSVPTKILYGEFDGLVSKDVIKGFAVKNGFPLTVMKNGEHWFHTEEQMSFLREWIVKSEAERKSKIKDVNV